MHDNRIEVGVRRLLHELFRGGGIVTECLLDLELLHRSLKHRLSALRRPTLLGALIGSIEGAYAVSVSLSATLG
jgi:hypothetical protein